MTNHPDPIGHSQPRLRADSFRSEPGSGELVSGTITIHGEEENEGVEVMVGPDRMKDLAGAGSQDHPNTSGELLPNGFEQDTQGDDQVDDREKKDGTLEADVQPDPLRPSIGSRRHDEMIASSPAVHEMDIDPGTDDGDHHYHHPQH